MGPICYLLLISMAIGLNDAVPTRRAAQAYERPTGSTCVLQSPFDSEGRAARANQLDALPNYPNCGESKFDKRELDELDEDKRIVNGDVSREGRWPWVVALGKVTGNRYFQFCGAAIIDRRWILTAAHCFTQKDQNDRIKPKEEWSINPCDYLIHSGQNQVMQDSNDLQLVGVKEVILHENYGVNDLENDIALLKLDKDLQLGHEDANVVCLPSAGQAYAADSCVVAGWGDTREGANRGSNILLHASIPKIDQQECFRYYPRRMSQNAICAGHPQGGTDSCQGDSGGPLMCQNGDHWVQMGVTSWGDGCARKDSPGVYTNVERFRDWIQETMTRYSGATTPVSAEPERPTYTYWYY